MSNWTDMEVRFSEFSEINDARRRHWHGRYVVNRVGMVSGLRIAGVLRQVGVPLSQLEVSWAGGLVSRPHPIEEKGDRIA
jgi:hypothetical protein